MRSEKSVKKRKRQGKESEEVESLNLCFRVGVFEDVAEEFRLPSLDGIENRVLHHILTKIGDAEGEP